MEGWRTRCGNSRPPDCNLKTKEAAMTQDLRNQYLGGNMHPADAMHEVRKEIKKLQSIEKKLRKILVENEDMRVGEWAEAVVNLCMVKRIDHEKVRQVVADLSSVITEKETPYVRVKKVWKKK
jgi:NAD-specific glutamate dehydrogenase